MYIFRLGVLCVCTTGPETSRHTERDPGSKHTQRPGHPCRLYVRVCERLYIFPHSESSRNNTTAPTTSIRKCVGFFFSFFSFCPCYTINTSPRTAERSSSCRQHILFFRRHLVEGFIRISLATGRREGDLWAGWKRNGKGEERKKEETTTKEPSAGKFIIAQLN